MGEPEHDRVVAPAPDGEPGRGRRAWTRRRFLELGIGGAVVVVGGVTAIELISHGVLPGKLVLDEIDGACSVDGQPLEFATLGPSQSGTFYSPARNRSVGYTIAYPPGSAFGDELPLIVMLHGYGEDHLHALSAMSPAQAVALKVGGRALPSMAMVTVDGGNGYWTPHPGDDPMAMVVDELIPFCQALGLGRPPNRIGVMGISMGGYGALLMAEKHPNLFSAAAAISPAIWTSWDQAHNANATAYAGAAAFDANDVVTHTASLARTPVRVAAGNDDPFLPGVQALVPRLPSTAVVQYGMGCHTGPFFAEQEPPSLQFLGQHLAAPRS